MRTFFFFLFVLPFTLFSETIVRLQPPSLDKEMIRGKIICQRPYRSGFANISLEKRGTKTIINCYGHGSSGWQTLFGSVQKGISLYQGNKEERVRVVGAGCMGLLFAIELARSGYHVEGITTKTLYDTASWNAAGYFGGPKDQPPDVEELFFQTFLTYQMIAKGAHPYLTKECVDSLPVYCTAETAIGIENLSSKGLIPPGRPVTLDFGTVRRDNFIEYHTLFIQVTEVMKQLLNEVRRLGIPIEYQEIDSFDGVKEGVIINCTGLGAKNLQGDSLLKPIVGHLIMIDDKIPHPYMIYTKVKQRGKEEFLYLYPKTSYVTTDCPEGMPTTCVLGGTFLEPPFRHKREFKKLLKRQRFFFYGK